MDPDGGVEVVVHRAGYLYDRLFDSSGVPVLLAGGGRRQLSGNLTVCVSG